ncbi:MAG: hypothetical protein QOG96_49, partial [Pseudonocardiales bacterium]|nr:hypothetical protein [Pseudonocardiales bacterium]
MMRRVAPLLVLVGLLAGCGRA